MSTALSTSRASSRPSKDKHAKAVTTHSAQIKSDGQSSKMQQVKHRSKPHGHRALVSN